MDIDAFFAIGYGMYVVSSEYEGRINGQIVNAVNQITVNPNTISVSICNDNYTHELIVNSKKINLSILDENTSMDFIELFGLNSGRDIDKFSKCEYRLSNNGVPFIKNNVVAEFELDVIDSLVVGDHTIFIGDVNSAVCFDNASNPLSYAEYRKRKKACETKECSEGMEQYECSVCHYIYDPQKGDEKGGVAPGVSFSDLPEDWVCPICKKPKSVFVKL